MTSAAGVSNDPRASHVSRVGRAFRGWRDPLALIAIVLAAWQLLYWYAGDVALTSPAATFGTSEARSPDSNWLPL